MNAAQTGRPVVAGVDGSESALEAVRWAAREAHRRQVPLRLVSAFGWTTGHHVGDPGLGTDYLAVLLQKARDEVAAAAVAASGVAAELAIEQEVVTGFPVPVLNAEAARAQLVVLGDRGLGGFTGLLVGSVAVALATHAPCPVVVVRGSTPDASPPLEGPVVVGIDGSPTSEAALAFAFEAAELRGVPLVAVHTWTDYQIESTMVAVLEGDAIDADEHRLLAERLAGWSEKFPDVSVRRLVTRYRPARTLIEQSGHAQLVVVGSRGRGGFAGMLLGSVSHALLHHAACPVAVVRPATAHTQ
ncbi:universal stress protein [Pseudonocardia sp. DSM 45834]|uniref:Universal stress protein n=2 Tax=Pseudonocardia charpentierae TaxID=3075545 RepID=A0ABU2NFX9_9PSEU|nr:universal stress protein [Pseudonocardia sp. DSM 45834]MDT0352866.1 universal stress protein [Pseudonocardia sp. DSM 45834]